MEELKANTIQTIEKLKKEQNALILAHFYDDAAIQNIADFVGDSYFLAKKGQESQEKVILLAGVVFMAESVKILNPDKTIIVPDLNAGCSLVDSSPYESYLAWRMQYPEAICVSYINCSAAVKTISDVICTSSNAEIILNSIPKNRTILFGPDQNLGHYLSKKYNRKMILWPGHCHVHILFSAQKLLSLILQNPDAVVLAHPECNDDILKFSHVVGSTSKLLNEVKTNKAKKFIVATESGILHQMKKARPDVELINAPTDESCACNECPYMKLNTLEKVASSLKTLNPKITLSQTVIHQAGIALERMMKISNGQSITWPTYFDPLKSKLDPIHYYDNPQIL